MEAREEPAMTAPPAADFFAEHSWMLGDAALKANLPSAARWQLETRLAAMVFRRRCHLIMRWRRHAHMPARSALSTSRRLQSLVTVGAMRVVCDLPALLPLVRAEVAILRAFLGREIDQLIFGANE
jgi:hypothetical protein